jgi:hypothetical protein
MDEGTIESFVGISPPEGVMDEPAVLHEAFEDAARQAVAKRHFNVAYEAHIEIETKETNQHVKTYRVTITPKG